MAAWVPAELKGVGSFLLSLCEILKTKNITQYEPVFNNNRIEYRGARKTFTNYQQPIH